MLGSWDCGEMRFGVRGSRLKCTKGRTSYSQRRVEKREGEERWRVRTRSSLTAFHSASVNFCVSGFCGSAPSSVFTIDSSAGTGVGFGSAAADMGDSGKREVGPKGLVTDTDDRQTTEGKQVSVPTPSKYIYDSNTHLPPWTRTRSRQAQQQVQA